MLAFDRQPTLQGELVELRPLRAEDSHALYAIAADPLVWEQHPSKERAQEPVFRKWFEGTLSSGGALAAVDRGTGGVIGTTRFELREPGDLEIGWTLLARSHWGRGFNTEMKRLMLEHAFRTFDHVIFEVHSHNFRSQRAVQKLGAVRVRSQPDRFGRGENFIFQLDASAWTPTRGEVRSNMDADPSLA